jgi:hypothetical protein
MTNRSAQGHFVQGHFAQVADLVSILLSDGGEVHGRGCAEFVVVAPKYVNLHDDGPSTGAQNPGDGAGRPGGDGPQIADE